MSKTKYNLLHLTKILLTPFMVISGILEIIASTFEEILIKLGFNVEGLGKPFYNFCYWWDRLP